MKEKNSKNPHNPKLSSKKKIPEWFGHKTSDFIDTHKDVVTNQRKMMFSKKVANRLDLWSDGDSMSKHREKCKIYMTIYERI